MKFFHLYFNPKLFRDSHETERFNLIISNRIHNQDSPNSGWKNFRSIDRIYSRIGSMLISFGDSAKTWSDWKEAYLFALNKYFIRRNECHLFVIIYATHYEMPTSTFKSLIVTDNKSLILVIHNHSLYGIDYTFWSKYRNFG